MNINFRSQRLLPGYDFLQSQNDTKPIKVLVHEFIQSVVFTPFPQDSELQVERLVLAGNIYEGIGFKRKAAFYRRFAALKSVTVQSNWQSCYDSLISSLDGFGLTLDPIEYEKALGNRCSSVWPGLHVQLIEELITCCKKIQNVQAGTLAIRHMSFVLHTLDFYLSASKKKDFARDLEEASTIFGEDSPVPLRLSSGYVIPTVNFTKYPLCLRFEPLPLAWSLRPVRLNQLRRRSMMTPTGAEDKKSENPFIFTPINNYNSMSIVEARRTDSNSIITDITWVQDEPCSTVLVLRNTLPFELNVPSITLLTDGVPLETKSSSLKLEPNPNSQVTVHLVGIPRQLPKSDDHIKGINNRIEVFGYSTHLLGVKSDCRLDMIPKNKFPSQYVVDICPPLPRIEFKFPDDLEDAFFDPIPADHVEKDLIVLECSIKVKPEQVFKTVLTIFNSSNVDVDYLYIRERIQKPLAPLERRRLVSWNDELLESLATTPLKAGTKLDVPLEFSGSKEMFAKSPDCLTTLLTFEYSGDIALTEMYCRKCTIKVQLEPAEDKPDLVIDDELKISELHLLDDHQPKTEPEKLDINEDSSNDKLKMEVKQ